MADQEKYSIVVKAIMAAYKKHPKAYTPVFITPQNKLDKLSKADTDGILWQLEHKEGVLRVYKLPYKSLENATILGSVTATAYQATSSKKGMTVPYRPSEEPVVPESYDYAIHVFSSGFKNCHDASLYRVKRKLEDLSDINLQRIQILGQELDKKFQVLNSRSFDFYSNINFEDQLKFLQDKGILLGYEQKYMGTGTLNKIMVLLDVEKYVKFQTKLSKICEARFPTKKDFPPAIKPEKADETAYQISFSMNNEILLNDLVVLAKPNLNSENTDIFSYLVKNPNKKVTKKEIEQHLGHSIGKDLHKIVENWGFTGDLRKAFFNVSKDVILFRNPLTRADLAGLSIPLLRIAKK